jgi:hypothetical protein
MQAKSRRRRLLLIALYLLFLLLIAEAGSRLFWTLNSGLSFLRPRLIEAYCPQLAGVRQRDLRSDDGTFDMLLLGGSVLVEGYLYDAYGRQTVYTPGTNGVVDFVGDDGVTTGGSSVVDNPYA